MNVLNETPWIKISCLDQLWFQVSGTLCNLTCHHCFISCSPQNDSFGFLTLSQVQQRLRESVPLGTREYYFTGGEPFLCRDLVPMLIETLSYGPTTVLTNGTVLKDAWLAKLAAAEADSIYSLEFRVSLDGFSPESNDPIRGDGTFQRTMEGVIKLAQHGFLPIITAARTWPDNEESEVVGHYVEMLRRAGYSQPRLKILPTLRLGAETQRTSDYLPSERVTESMMNGYDVSQLICEHSRVVTDRGICVCPILIESEDALLSHNLADSLRPYAIQHGACYTCYQHGAICTNPSSGTWSTTAKRT